MTYKLRMNAEYIGDEGLDIIEIDPDPEMVINIKNHISSWVNAFRIFLRAADFQQETIDQYIPEPEESEQPW